MKKYICIPCGWIYDPEVGDPDGGIAPGTAFEDVPEDWEYDLIGRPDEQSSVFDVQTKALKVKMQDAVVTECRLSPVNDMVIVFSNGVVLEQFMPATRKDEEWRLIDYKKDEHIVCYEEDGPFPIE